MIADPAFDVGLLLYWYIPEDQWERLAHSIWSGTDG